MSAEEASGDEICRKTDSSSRYDDGETAPRNVQESEEEEKILNSKAKKRKSDEDEDDDGGGGGGPSYSGIGKREPAAGRENEEKEKILHRQIKKMKCEDDRLEDGASGAKGAFGDTVQVSTARPLLLLFTLISGEFILNICAVFNSFRIPPRICRLQRTTLKKSRSRKSQRSMRIW